MIDGYYELMMATPNDELDWESFSVLWKSMHRAYFDRLVGYEPLKTVDHRMKAFGLPARIVQTMSFVSSVSMEPQFRMIASSLDPRSGMINSASPSTAILALCVSIMTWRCSLMFRRDLQRFVVGLAV